MDTINFEEFSPKEKEDLLNKIDARSKIYHFDDFELALCKYDDNYGIGITCKNDFLNPFSPLEETDQIFTEIGRASCRERV